MEYAVFALPSVINASIISIALSALLILFCFQLEFVWSLAKVVYFGIKLTSNAKCAVKAAKSAATRKFA